ncbi:MAG: type VI secretion system protein TssA [bacterium]
MNIEIYMQPISDNSPSGRDARYELEYQEVVGEIQKLTAMSSAQDAINWDNVVDLSRKILIEKSKDLTIAGYLCVGLFKKEGYQGVCDGLRIYCHILENFWDGLFPQKPKARKLAIEWLNQRLGNLLTVRNPSPKESQAVLDAYELIKRLDQLIRERFADQDPPSISNMISGFSEQAESIQPTATVKEPKSQEIDKQQASPAEVLAAPSAIESASVPTTPNIPSSPQIILPQPGQGNTEIINAIRQMASSLRANNLQDPLPYRLLRCIKWDTVRSIPPAGGDGKTRIPVPKTQVSDSLKNLNKQGNWLALIEEAESTFQDPGTTFWFDLQRMTYNGLMSIGYEDTARVIASETEAFLNRLPGIMDLSFSNGIPFADEETMQWIATQVISMDGEQLQVGEISGENDDADLQEALELITQRNLEGALRVLQQGMNQQTSYKKRFMRRLAAGKYCLQLGKTEWAKAILEGLDKEIDTVSLKAWEPEICVQVWTALYQCYQKLMKKSGDENIMKQSAEKILIMLFQHNIRAGID